MRGGRGGMGAPAALVPRADVQQQQQRYAAPACRVVTLVSDTGMLF